MIELAIKKQKAVIKKGKNRFIMKSISQRESKKPKKMKEKTLFLKQ